METETRSKEVGELLFEQGKLGSQQLELARRRQQSMNISQHRAIMDLHYVSEEDAGRALAQASNLEFVDLAGVPLSKAVLDQVPVKLILHYHMIPIASDADSVTLAFGEPPRPMEQGNLRLLLNKRPRIVLATPSGIHEAIKKHFGLGAETIQKLREDRTLAEGTSEIVFDVKSAGESEAVDATIAAFVDQILLEALRLDATDIHIEPAANSVRLRYRIDGLLQEIPVPGNLRQIHAGLVSRLKIMASLNIAEKRLPHDGRIAMKTGRGEYDLRISVIPTKFGETIAMRILGRENLFLDLKHLGMEPDQEALFARMTGLPQGMILITGPTGSGKTTTLYAALAHANDGERKIITIENPVEYQLEGTTQIQTRDDIGLTFASGLRSVLRHDPDVVLIGEIRDTETAEIAVRAAQTGHLVFSTLHTNDSVSTITRLLEMKIDPFLIGSSLVSSIAQRLARRVCRHCGEDDAEISDEMRREMAAALGLGPGEVKARKGRGCTECGQRGNRGRLAIYEFFVITDEISDMIDASVRTGELRRAARQSGWRSLREAGWKKVAAGLVSIAEHERLTRRLDLHLDAG